ncbi:MAG: VCBS repeat-containing protein [Planctomycetes bacterium]|nr:VCBS repeat-containing protein [Planctomycetota bacterium]
MSALGIALAAAAQAAAAKSAAKPEFARVATLAVEADWKPVAALVADVDGDGVSEVVLACCARGKSAARRLEIWRAAAGSYARAKTIELTSDVVAIATGDVLAGNGAEVLAFHGGGAFALAPLAGEARAERIVECDFLWQVPDPETVHVWQDGVLDLDLDGLDDLVLPEPGGFLLCVQRRPRQAGAFGLASRLRVPEEADSGGVWVSATRREGPAVRGRRQRLSYTLELSQGAEETLGSRPAILAQASESVSSPHFSDWDADGDLDLVLQTSHHLHAFTQERGTFAAAAAHSLELPVAVDTARRLDASYSSHAVDLDLDRRADCVIFAGDKRSEDVRTQGLFFTQAGSKDGPAPFGAQGRPSSLLVFAGFVSGPRFVDLDGDRYPELVLRAVRPDLIDQLRSASSKAIDAELYIYRNRRGVFSRQPDVTWKRTIPLERFQLTAEFCGDLTGDGLSELLARDEPDKLRVMLLRSQGSADKSTWTLFDRPLWEIGIHEDATVEVVPARAGEAKPSVLVIEPTQVLFVRFG